MNLTGPVRPAAYARRPVHQQRWRRWPGQPTALAAMTPPGPALGRPDTERDLRPSRIPRLSSFRLEPTSAAVSPRFHGGSARSRPVGAPSAAATAILGHLDTWPVRAAKPFRNPRPVMLAGAGQVGEGSRRGALLEVGWVIVHGGDRRAGEAAMALMRMAAYTQLGVDGWCLATPVGVAGRASGRSGVRPREL